VPRPKLRTAELSEQVLEAALRLLAQEGLEVLTARRLAREADTSPAAIYELFGDKAGVLRALFFSGFTALAEQLRAPAPAGDPLEGILLLVERYRRFLLEHPALAALMFSRPFASFDPGPEELAAGAAVREAVLLAVQRGIDAGVLSGNPSDIALAFIALIHGLAAAERAGWLAARGEAVERRWQLAVHAMLAGFSGRNFGAAVVSAD
jgi:AcrR family transcriptional regulator